MVKRSMNLQPKESPLRNVFLLTILIACLLPLLTFAVVYGVFDNFLPKAAEQNTLRVWLEPSSIVVKENQPITLTVMAAYDREKGLVSNLHATIKNDTNADISPRDISFQQPFQGKTTVGVITFRSGVIGSHEVTIPKDSITVTGETNPNILVGGTTVMVR